MEIILWLFLFVMAAPFILPWFLPTIVCIKLTWDIIKKQNR